MRLYHGSNVEVIKPKIIENNRALDFGKGFYLTTDLEQAKRWAKLKSDRIGTGNPVVSVYEYNEDNSLKMLKFKEANSDWLLFVSNNRKLIYNENSYDIIIGPVANDNTVPVINMYLNGQYDIEEAIKRLLPQNLKNQVVFKTEKSLEKLKFVEVLKYD